jgi:nitroreductase
MNVFEAIESRRSVKHYDPNHRMSEAETKKILAAAALSPTAFNIQHWRLVHVKDPSLRKTIRAAAWDQAQVTDASMLLVLCGDLKAWEKNPKRYWKNAPENVQDFMSKAIDGYYRGKPQTERDEVMRSAGIIAQTIMLTAREMGYDSCPMDGFDFDAVGRLINLPKDHAIGMMLVVGKATTPARERGGQLPVSEIVVENHF